MELITLICAALISYGLWILLWVILAGVVIAFTAWVLSQI